MRSILFLFFMIKSSLIFSQNNKQDIISKFIITYGTINGADITNTLLDQNAFIVFYTNNDNELYMANILTKNNTQSFGKLYYQDYKIIDMNRENYKTEVFYFRWQYINSYDNNKGNTPIELIKTYKPQGVTFRITIVTENLDIIIYKGYLEGTLDLDKYIN